MALRQDCTNRLRRHRRGLHRQARWRRCLLKDVSYVIVVEFVGARTARCCCVIIGGSGVGEGIFRGSIAEGVIGVVPSSLSVVSGAALVAASCRCPCGRLRVSSLVETRGGRASSSSSVGAIRCGSMVDSNIRESLAAAVPRVVSSLEMVTSRIELLGAALHQRYRGPCCASSLL